MFAIPAIRIDRKRLPITDDGKHRLEATLTFSGPVDLKTLLAAAKAGEEGLRSGGQKEAAKRMAGVLVEAKKKEWIPSVSIAAWLAEAGDTDQAFHWLDVGLRDRELGMLELKTNPSFASLRSDPRFNELVKKVGLP